MAAEEDEALDARDDMYVERWLELIGEIRRKASAY
jgi:hypothetical protein